MYIIKEKELADTDLKEKEAITVHREEKVKWVLFKTPCDIKNKLQSYYQHEEANVWIMHKDKISELDFFLLLNFSSI